MTEQRRLAAVVSADVVGYSRLMGRDESGTLSRLRAHRTERLEPILKRRSGRIVKLTGDGALVEFGSAVEAVSAAIEFQQAMAEANRDQPEDSALAFRMGVHLGDLIVDGDDLYGDGVNVAARLEGQAPAGGILVSGDVHNAVASRLKATFDDLGDLRLKNIERPVRAFRVAWKAADWREPISTPSAATAVALSNAPLALPDKPSIAVLPFTNMSGDPDQEYFVDGLIEDIITALSRFKSLFVIARNSSFTYKGKAVDVRQVGRELGVRYVLEGSIRKVGGQVRITGQLLDATTGAHVWAERYEGALQDVFDLQDRVTHDIVVALDLSISTAEITRTLRKPTSDLTASDCYYRAVLALRRYTQQSVDEAEALFARAAEADSEFSTAYGMATWCHIGRKAQGWPHDPRTAAAEVRRLAALAWDADKDDAFAIGVAGYALAYVCEDVDTGHTWLERALWNNANVAHVWTFAGTVKGFLGLREEAAEYAERAIRLSPRDPAIVMPRNIVAQYHYWSGRYEQAVELALKNLHEHPRNVVTLRIAAAALALNGDLDQAKIIMARLREADPTLTPANLHSRMGPYRSDELPRRLLAGLRLAGLPE